MAQQAASILPPASRSSALPAPSLYGRQDAQDCLIKAYYNCISRDSPTVVFVTGEGGLGKTRFLLETEAKLHRLDENVTVAYGRALAQHSGSNGYQPVREALADLVFEAQRKNRSSLLKRVSRAMRTTAPDWLEAVPAVGSLLKAATMTISSTLEERPRELETSLTRQFCDLVTEIIADGPFVLCLDDLHWADTSTVDLVYSLTQTVRSGPFVLICSYREGDLHRAEDAPHPLLETIYRIERYCSVTRVELTHLTAKEVSQLVEDSTGRSPVPRLVATLMKLTNGNPLFVQEYLGLLIDKLDREASPASLAELLELVNSSGPPRRVEAVIEERLLRLSDDEVRTLEVAALLGPVFVPDDLMAVLDIGAQSARAALRSLCRRHALINAVPRPDRGASYAFHHATVAQVLEGRLRQLDPFDYQELHRSIAAHLRSANQLDLTLLERLAHHTLASGDIDAALAAALEAATASWKLGAVTESLRLLKKVTEPLDLPWRDVSVVIAAATLRLRAANAVADHEDAVQFGIVLSAHARFKELLGVEARLAIARALRMTNRWSEARDLATAVAQGRDDISSNSQAEALLLLGQIELCGTPARVEAALEALHKAEVLTPDPHILYQIVGCIGLSRLVLHDHLRAFGALELAIRHAAETGQPLDRYEALHWRSKAEIACLRLAEAMRTLDELEQICDKAGVASSVPFHVRDRARVLALQGRLTSSSVAYCRYLETVSQLNSAMQFRRGLATLAFQCIELHELDRSEDARRLSDSFVEPLTDSWLDSGQRAAVTLTLELAAEQFSPEGADALESSGVITYDDIAAVDAIYRFDIPNLAVFRQRLVQADD